MKKNIHFSHSRFLSGLAIAALAIFMILPGKGWGQNYQSFDASTTNAWTGNFWSTSSAANACVSSSLTNAFTPGSIVYLCTPNGTGYGTVGISIGGIIATENYTLSTGTGTILTGGAVVTIDVASGKTVDLEGANISSVSGTGIIKAGDGTLSWSNSTAYPGGFTLSNGTMIIGSVNALGLGGPLNINGGTLAASATKTISSRYSGINIGGDFTFGNSVNAKNISFADNVYLGLSTARTITIGSIGTYTLSGIVSGTGSSLSVNATAAGTLSLGGANTYDGGTTITGGTLLLGAAGVLADAGTVTLNGGTLKSGASTGNSETMGTLALAGNSTIALGTGVHALNFAASNGITWSGTTLTITGWVGTAGTSGTAGQIFVGSDATGLTPQQLAKINFAGYTTGGKILSSGEIVPASAAPILVADATNNDVDHNIDITFTPDATWEAAITAVKIGGTALTVATDYVVSSGNIQLKPSGSNALLTTSGSKAVTVEATGYTTVSVTQVIDAGAAAKLAIIIQPTAPATNGGTLGTQPVIVIRDQYNNATTSTATIVAAVGAGTWTLGGTTSVDAISGTATFSGLTATSTAAVTGATISFTSGSLIWVTSSTFDIPTPPTITLSVTTLTGFTYAYNSGPSAEQSYTVSGTDLAGDLTLTPPANYEISTGTGALFVVTKPITLTPSSGSVATTTIYVRLKAGLSAADFNSENIAVASTGTTTQNVACSGTVTPALWLHMITTGQPAAIRYLGDKLNAISNWYINFELGQLTWNQTDAGIGKSNTDPSDWTWKSAIFFANGTNPNKQVQADFGNFQFTSTGNWYFNGRAKSNSIDPFNYANSATWQNTNLFAPTEYFLVNELTDPLNQTASAFSTTQIDLSWVQDATPHNVMIVRKKSTESWTEPTQGTSYILTGSIGAGVVVYNGVGTFLSNTGLEAGTTYDYKFYSENYSYYSAGVTASATTYAVPTISGFTPDNVCTGSSVSVVISGTNFTGATAVKFNGTNADSFIINSATQITAMSPTTATAGTISVTTPIGTATSSTSYTVGGTPTAYAGLGGLVTAGIPTLLSDATASHYTSVSWKKTSGIGDGTFNNNTLVNPTFTGTSDGPITLTLTAYGCDAATATSEVTLYIISANPVTWYGAYDEHWNNPSNWVPAFVPTTNYNVLIQSVATNYPIILATDAAACKNITLESGASIIGNEFLAVSGTQTIERTITSGKWHFISATNNNTYSDKFTGNFLQSWSEPDAAWAYITATTDKLNPVQGYSLWVKTSAGASKTYAFTGAFNSGEQSIGITKSGTSGVNDGANFLGNPYPSYIQWSSALQTAYGSLYYWNGTGYDAYAAVTGFGTGNEYVAPMQGFFIVAPAAGTFTLNDANRANSTTSPFYKSGLSIKPNTLVLATVGESYSDKLFVNFNPAATEGFDLQNDAYKFLGYTAGVSELYSYTGDKKLSIDVRPETQVVQLGFTNTLSGDYQIGIDQIADIPVAYLEDTKTSTFHDLLSGPYSFSYTAGESDKRFLLHFGTTGLKETGKDAATIYSYQKTVYINMVDQLKGDIFIYNMAGQQVATRTSVQGMNEIKLPNTGNYIVKVISKNSTVVRKVFIQ